MKMSLLFSILFFIILFCSAIILLFLYKQKTNKITEHFDKSFYENINYQYDQYNYGDEEYTTPLECKQGYELLVDPNLPSTKGCYISLKNMKRYYNPYLTDCPTIWNYNTTINGEKYCRQNGANIPVTFSK